MQMSALMLTQLLRLTAVGADADLVVDAADNADAEVHADPASNDADEFS